jgi:hypothetical protein
LNFSSIKGAKPILAGDALNKAGHMSAPDYALR